MTDYGILDQLANGLRTWEHVRGTDPRNIAWADEAADRLEKLLTGSRLLIAQYQTHDNFTMGGALNNDPFMQITEALEP